MIKKVLYLYLFATLSLSGCIAESDDIKDSDKDGIADKVDCAPENAKQWQLQTYNSIDNDLDGKFIEGTGKTCSGDELPTQYMPTKISASDSDCDDSNQQIWAIKTYNSIDVDLDSRFIQSKGEICSGDELPTQYMLAKISASQSDCNDTDSQIWALKTYNAIDSDLDGKFTLQSGIVCSGNSLPAKFQLSPIDEFQVDCNDQNKNVWQLITTYNDADHDGYGAGDAIEVCTGEIAPDNFSLIPGDCNDDNSDLFSQLHYQAVDSDLDGFQIHSSGTECTNGTLPDTHKVSFDNTKAPDCDDSNNQAWQTVELYKDDDNDTFGAGEQTMHCIGNNNPTFWVEENGDCADDNNQIWRNEYVYADTDTDTFGDLNNSEYACIGLQPSAGQVLDSSDCDDSNTAIWRLDHAYFDIDGDGIGAGAIIGHCTNEQPASNTSNLSYDCDDSNAAIWRLDQAYFDIDGDGIGAGAIIGHCTNEQSASNTSNLSYDCDDNDADIFRKITIYPDTDGDGIGAGRGSLTCMGNSYLEENISIYGYDPEPNNAAVSNLDLSPAILAAP